jgi:hypothetical protein
MAHDNISPNAGQAPGPQRTAQNSANLGSTNDGQPAPHGATLVISPGQNGEPQQTWGPDGELIAPVQQSAPPANPGEASELAALRQQNGQLLRQIGQDRQDAEIRQMEFELRMEAQLAAMAPQQPDQIQLPPGVDPEAQLNVGQMLQLLNNVAPGVTSNAVRGSWDVTPQEEQAVLQSNPAINNVAEPAKTELIKRAVSLLRQRQTPAQQQQQSPPAASPEAASYQPVAQRPAAPTVPNPETSQAPAYAPEAGGGTVQDANAAANARYYELKAQLPACKTKKEKRMLLAQMKSAMIEARNAAGVSETEMGKAGWTQE